MAMKKVKGEKMEGMSDKPVRRLPRFTLSEEDLPQIKEWQVGKKYTMEVEVEMTSLQKDQYDFSMEDEKKKMSASFKMTKIGTKKVEDMDADEFAKTTAKVKSGKGLYNERA